jgi:ABC-type multidrug transport system permease subunit
MLSGFVAALGKDFRLLLRDRVGLVFMTLAPVVVITVAGLSLANLYGAKGGTSAFLLPLVDEDGGRVGRALADRLRDDRAVRVTLVPDRGAARALVRAKQTGAALVVPAGTSAALAAGQPSQLILYTDPVKVIELDVIRDLVQEIRHQIEVAARDDAVAELEATRRGALEARAALDRAAADLRRELDDDATRLAAARSDASRARREGERALSASLTRLRAEQKAAARAALGSLLNPLRSFLADLDARGRAFTAWAAAARAQAGRFADRIPPPPDPPAVPPTLAELARAKPDALAARLVPPVSLPPLPTVELPTLPAPPAGLHLPELPEPAAARLPGMLAIEETSVTGAPRTFNTFDQNVPGFSITFLLLGMLLGISLALLDERDWGTFARLRATPTPLAAVLGAKLTARLVVGVLQMALLFAVGRLFFGVSLGPEPWALALPTVGVVAAGAAFGLVVAGLAQSREAVLPLGSIAILTMAAAGGCWWPIDLEPGWMQSVARAFPTFWAMDAFNDLMIRRQTAGAVTTATLVLLAYAAAYLILGLMLFRRRTHHSR